MNAIVSIVFELGSLVVSHMASNNLRLRGYYWKDAQATGAYGPFPTVYDTMEHYKVTIQAFNMAPLTGMPTPPPLIQGKDNIIYVNFLTKEKINA